MNINQYMCNMKVLAGLFLANNTRLGAFLYQGGMDMINFRDRINPLINFNLRISFKDRNIELHIESDSMIYMQGKKYNPNTRTFTGPALIFLQ